MKALHPSDARVVAGYQLIARLGAVALTVTGDGEATYQWHYLDDSELGDPAAEGPVG